MLLAQENIDEDIHVHLMKTGKSFMERYDEREKRRREREHEEYKQRMLRGSGNTWKQQSSPPQPNAEVE